MALHRMASVDIGVPNLAETAQYYADFGLQTGAASTSFSTVDGGEQLRLHETPTRRLVGITIGADDTDDLDRIAAGLDEIGIAHGRSDTTLSTVEPATMTKVDVTVEPRVEQGEVAPTAYNGPGRLERVDGRAPGVERDEAVRPRKLGHVVFGTPDVAATERFFLDGIGFKLSDRIGGAGAFMRCSTDHHNVLAMQAPLAFLHHTSWQVDDIDDVGRGAANMLAGHPERHIWGLGRHHAGSNFFWYLKDPAGNFSEYYSDMDSIVNDELWTPETFEGAKGLFSWGPPPPPSFLAPDDLAELMSAAHH